MNLLCFDINRLNNIALFNLFHNIHSTSGVPKDGVFAVEVRNFLQCDVKLRAARSFLWIDRIGQTRPGQCSLLVRKLDLLRNSITRPPSTRSIGVAALNYKIRNDAMENQAVVEAAFGQLNKIRHR